MTNSVRIRVGVSLAGNYKINAKSDGRRLDVHGWDLSESEALKSKTANGCRMMYHGNYWFEDCTVVDADGELPDTLYVIARCYREWEGVVGGSSWYATEAFVSLDKAREYTERWESKLNWQWIVSSRRASDSVV